MNRLFAWLWIGMASATLTAGHAQVEFTLDRECRACGRSNVVCFANRESENQTRDREECSRDRHTRLVGRRVSESLREDFRCRYPAGCYHQVSFSYSAIATSLLTCQIASRNEDAAKKVDSPESLPAGSVDYETNETLREINDRFQNLSVQIIRWPDELHKDLGNLKEYAYVGLPKNKPGGKLPLLIALHGAGGKRKGLEEQLLRSSEVKGLALAELAGRDLVLLEPNSSDSWDPHTLDVMLDYVLDTYRDIDENRVYVMGHSMGGTGTWNWILESANRFAAAAPCGFGEGADTTGIEKLVNLPVWGMAGGEDGDRTANVEKMVNNLRAAGNRNVRYTAFPGAGHAEGNAAVFSSVELVDWMLSFSRE